MVEIHADKCIGCGKCVGDCVVGNLELKERTAAAVGECFLCGHCVAVCPTGAVAIPEYDMAEVEECSPRDVELDAARLLRAIKFRRSIRNYQPRLVEKEKLKMVLEAGRYTATAKNTQGCRFIVVREELETLKNMIWNDIAEMVAVPSAQMPEWTRIYRKLYRMKKSNPQDDFLFRNAPSVLFIAADVDIDAGLAAQNMELAAVSQGLGMLYNGYLLRVANGNEAVRNWLGAGEKQLRACALLGYPAVTYVRTAPRRAGDYVFK